MSYNIDSIEVIYSQGFSIGPRYEELAEKYAGEAPETNVFYDDWNINRGFWWSGEGSGSSYDVMLDVLSSFNGEADLVLTWEGGDSFEGLRLRDHKVTKHKVVMTLGEEVR
jgi:hypothetical protein